MDKILAVVMPLLGVLILPVAKLAAKAAVKVVKWTTVKEDDLFLKHLAEEIRKEIGE